MHDSELDEIASVQDVRDLDILVTKILDKAVDFPLSPVQADDLYLYQPQSVRALIMNIAKDPLQLLEIAEVKAAAIISFICRLIKNRLVRFYSY